MKHNFECIVGTYYTYYSWETAKRMYDVKQHQETKELSYLIDGLEEEKTNQHQTIINHFNLNQNGKQH